ncbi:sigma-70 family RNA polymerase sigma factor [Fodinicola feengrottensis]|uniref:Sigma-70 family RNA polymerase sigma factor n=2 Tax=Fodinicola feengrottensis TaxID=435914 RepID=A0ABN2IL60_9ACTN|nr:sigma-70 family RNA polymerase sigma factor [Fodinicola feengrottensis]
MAQVAERNTSALDTLYERYGKPAYSLARRITGDEGFAQDVVQDVFLALWKDPDSYHRARGGFASWLLSVTHHKAVDAVRREESLRRRRSLATQEFLVEQNANGVSQAVYDRVWTTVIGERVRGALSQLPSPQRDALVLAYFGGYTQREVATLTNTALGTVKTRMLAGMRRLRVVLGAGLAPEGGAL